MTQSRDFASLGQRRQSQRQSSSLFRGEVCPKLKDIIWPPVEAGPDMLKYGLIGFALCLRIQLAKNPCFGLVAAKLHCVAPFSVT